MMERLLDLLAEDPVRNANLMNFVRNYPVQSVEFEGRSVMVRGRSDRNWVYFSSQDESEMQRLVERLTEEDRCFAILEDWMKPLIPGALDPVWELTCMKLYWPPDRTAPKPQGRVHAISGEWAREIFQQYKYSEFATEEYVRERLDAGPALGMFDRGKLVAWILTHDDGAIGALQVLEEYRRRGYGEALTSAMISELQNQDKVAFVHIEEDNLRSMGLALKAGFVKDRRVRWLERRMEDA